MPGYYTGLSVPMLAAVDRPFLISQAGVEDIAKSLISGVGQETGKLSSIRSKPFETIFKYLGTGFAFMRFGWMVGLLVGVAELFGIGPSKLGAYLDEALGFGGTSPPSDISQSSLARAAKGMVDKVIGLVRSKSAMFEQCLITRQGEFRIDDLIVAWAAGPDPIVSEGATSIWQRAARWLGLIKGQQRLSLIAVLYGFLKMLLVGVLAHAGISFIGRKIGIGDESEKGSFPGLKEPSSDKRRKPVAGPTWRRYKNVTGDVEKSIVLSLDNMMSRGGRSFSRLFEEARKKPLLGSSEMNPVLRLVQRAHAGMPIEEINNYGTFVGPDPMDIARMLLPEYTYMSKDSGKGREKKRSLQEIDREIGSILGGKKA